ncbi:hypothetical protein O6H91_12G011400 [Diphasiastrum complanatum]|uniref:Uncharacterized protein n=1 Tax=Diphasiastrum complanatum TaxID=34168 RepID=A0ACC2BYX2_DIPCM|nr:hypothetical protein O6H91_12G011400 [Diphasiastrum complanatum]
MTAFFVDEMLSRAYPMEIIQSGKTVDTLYLPLNNSVSGAVSAERRILRKQYVETIIPPSTTLLRRWRPLLSGMHELTDADGRSPLTVEDRALATDAFPSESLAICMNIPRSPLKNNDECEP